MQTGFEYRRNSILTLFGANARYGYIAVSKQTVAVRIRFGLNPDGGSPDEATSDNAIIASLTRRPGILIIEAFP